MRQRSGNGFLARLLLRLDKREVLAPARGLRETLCPFSEDLAMGVGRDDEERPR